MNLDLPLGPCRQANLFRCIMQARSVVTASAVISRREWISLGNRHSELQRRGVPLWRATVTRALSPADSHGKPRLRVREWLGNPNPGVAIMGENGVNGNNLLPIRMDAIACLLVARSWLAAVSPFHRRPSDRARAHCANAAPSNRTRILKACGANLG
jgi:hypothetical protein